MLNIDAKISKNMVVTVMTLMLTIFIKGLFFLYFWNTFLIGWAGISLPTIGLAHSVFIAFLINTITADRNTSSN